LLGQAGRLLGREFDLAGVALERFGLFGGLFGIAGLIARVELGDGSVGRIVEELIGDFGCIGSGRIVLDCNPGCVLKRAWPAFAAFRIERALGCERFRIVDDNDRSGDARRPARRT